jgi:hypothetical protein
VELTVPVEGGHLWADDTGGDGPVMVLPARPARLPPARRGPRASGRGHRGPRVPDGGALRGGDRRPHPGCEQVPAPGADHMLPLRAPDLIAQLAAKLAG